MTRLKSRSSVGLGLEDSRNRVPTLNTNFSSRSFINQVQKLTNDQRNAISRTGFGNLLEIPYRQLSKTLLTELMGRWNCNKHAFMLLPGPIRVTLMDVALILGLPVVGHPILLRQDEPFLPLEKAYGAALWNRRITVSHLERRLDSIGGNADDDFVRTFLMFTIGTLLLPDNYGKVDSRYLSFLKNLDDINGFAWGVAVLDDMLMWLNKRKETNLKSVGGCLIFLQIWSYEHINIVRPKELDSCLKFPRACRWEDSGPNRRQKISEELKKLQSQQITWELQPTSAELQNDVIKDLLEEQNSRNGVTEMACSSDSCSVVGVADLESESNGQGMKNSNDMQVFEVGSESDADSGVKKCNNSEKLAASNGVSALRTEDTEHSRTSNVLEQMELNESTDVVLEKISESVEEQNVELKKENERLKGEIENLRDQLMRMAVLEEDNKELRGEMDELRREKDRLTSIVEYIVDQVDTIISKYLPRFVQNILPS